MPAALGQLLHMGGNPLECCRKAGLQLLQRIRLLQGKQQFGLGLTQPTLCLCGKRPLQFKLQLEDQIMQQPLHIILAELVHRHLLEQLFQLL
ncbi:hypothetical protein D3C75_1026160 [compost metagenome]